MSRITSVRQARKAIEDQEIKIGTILTDTDGTFQVTAVNPHSNIVIDAVELDYMEDDYITTDKEYRWTLADMISMEF